MLQPNRQGPVAASQQALSPAGSQTDCEYAGLLSASQSEHSVYRPSSYNPIMLYISFQLELIRPRAKGRLGSFLSNFFCHPPSSLCNPLQMPLSLSNSIQPTIDV